MLWGLNVLVSGGTQAGKTTMLNALCAAIPATERVITAEEVFELQVPLPDVVSMQTRQPNLEGTGEITPAPAGQRSTADAARTGSWSARCARRSAWTC